MNNELRIMPGEARSGFAGNNELRIMKLGIVVLAVVLLGLGCTDSQDPSHPEEVLPTKDLLQEDANIILDYPIEGGIVTSPLTFTGTARVFENVVEWRVLDDQLNELASGITVANPADIGQFGPFSETIFLPVISTNTFYLELFSTSAQDGSEQDLVSVELGILPVGQTTVKVFFMDDAGTVDGFPPVADFEKRTAQKTVSVAEFAILELLKGPESEWANQYIPDSTTLDHIEIGEGNSEVFFIDSENETWCSGTWIESGRYDQIAETMKQFPSVLGVDVYVNGTLFACNH